MHTYDISRSQALYARAQEVIPGGIFGHYGYSVRPDGPKFFSRAEGARFWDVDGNEYIDYMCACGPMILGYHNHFLSTAHTEADLQRTWEVADAAFEALGEPELAQAVGS